MIKDQSLRLDVVIIAVLILMATTIIIILFFRETTKSLAEEPKGYCARHPDDADQCVCEDRMFESENTRYHWRVCEDMSQYVEGEDCNIFLDISTCNKSRKKTIADLNCTELRDYFENGRQCEGVWPHRVCRYPHIKNNPSITNSLEHDLLCQMMLNGCTSGKITPCQVTG